MRIQESLKQSTPEELEKLRDLHSKYSKQLEKRQKIIEESPDSENATEEDKEKLRARLREIRKESDKIWGRIVEINKDISNRFLESMSESELMEYAFRVLESLTFEDFIYYLSRNWKPEWIQVRKPDLIFYDSIVFINDYTDFGIIASYFTDNLALVFTEQFDQLISKQDQLARDFKQGILDNIADLPELFKKVKEEQDRQKSNKKSHTSESDIEYIEREPSPYMHLSTSMYTQTSMRVLSQPKMRARENPNQQVWNFSDSGYTISTIKEERLGLHGLALGYQKQSKNKNTKHPIFVLQNAEVITSKHNYNVRKILLFALDKLFENNHLRKTGTMPEYLDITTKELLDNQVFNSRKEANEGMNESIMPLHSLSLAVYDNGTIIKVCSLFPKIERLERETKTSVSTYRIHFDKGENINYLGLFSQFTPCPSYLYRLSNRAGTLLYLIFTRANENKDKFKEGASGTINIKLSDIQRELDLPSLEDVRKARKENERILEPIKKAVIEITETDKETCPNESMLTIRWSPRKNLTAREYIEQGYLKITIESDYILKKYREIESDHEHKTEATRKRIARNKRLKEDK